MYPKVSICIPAYDYPEFLKRCLLSVITQTFTDFEIIVTDDSKHKKLEEVVNELNDSRIVYYKNTSPLGSPANWNYALKHAKGELIKILHHDDWFTDDMALEKFVSHFLKHPQLSFVFCQCIDVEPKKNRLHSASDIFYRKLSEMPQVCLYVNGIGGPSVTMFKKEVKEIAFDTNTKWYVDILFYVTVFMKYKNVGYIKEPLLNITAGAETQVTNTTSGIIKTKEVIHAFHHFSYFKKRHLPLLSILLFAELFIRYQIKSFYDLESMGFEKAVTERLKTSFYISKLPFHFRIYAFIRRTIINYLPIKFNC